MPDFLASIAVFAAIASVFLFSWNSVIANQGQFADTDNLRTEAHYTTTFLVSTPGYPDNWTHETVEIPGFATKDNLLQQNKIEEFSKLTYEQQKRLFTVEDFYLSFSINGSSEGSSEKLGSGPVAYIAESSSDMSGVKAIESLNSSNTTWDLYWPSDSSEGKLESLNSRNTYNYTTSGVEMTEDLFQNASEGKYSTIIAEDINIQASDINNNDSLQEFVRSGGSFVHTESDPNLITKTFDLNESDDDSESAVVEKVDPLLNSSLEVGDTIEFDDSNAAYENPDQMFANGTDSDAGCVACGWEKGAGSLYYVSDSFSDNDGVGLVFDDADNSIGLSYSFGRKPVNASTVIPINRDVLLNSSQGMESAGMTYVVWR